MTLPWDSLAELVPEASELVLAAPYIKEGTLSDLLSLTGRATSLTCVTRWLPGDIAVGISDVSVRQLILERGGDFRLHPSLHAKYYRCDAYVLIGSANLTEPGMGLGASPNFEILALADRSFDASGFERDLLVQSRSITDAEYELWASIRVEGHKSAIQPEGAALNWRPLTRNPEDLWLVYSGNIHGVVSPPVRESAGFDLDGLMIPTELDRYGFAVWVSAALLSSPFVCYVSSLSEGQDGEEFIQVSDDWRMAPADARYAAETARSWLAHFGLQR